MKLRINNSISHKPYLKDLLLSDCHKFILETYNIGRYSNGYFYLRARGNKSTIPLHKVLCWCPKGFEVDHINGNKSDNRVSNLRAVTKSQNRINTKLKENKSGVRGVCFDKSRKRWIASIQIDKKVIQKRFKNKQDAIDFRKKLESEYHGKYVRGYYGQAG